MAAPWSLRQGSANQRLFVNDLNFKVFDPMIREAEVQAQSAGTEVLPQLAVAYMIELLDDLTRSELLKAL